MYSDKVDVLQAMRKNLKKEVRSCVDKIGPQMFKNFDKMKLVMMKGS
jgi:hypothetical protein